MKLEQAAIISAQLLPRSRVDFDTAIDEMGWQNPRKLRTDLNLENKGDSERFIVKSMRSLVRFQTHTEHRILTLQSRTEA